MTPRPWPADSVDLLGPARLERLLQHALRYSPADETEAAYTGTTLALTRFAHNAIHQNMTEADAQVEVRLVLGARIGQASTNDISPAGLEHAVDQALALARHLPPDPEWPGLAEPRPLPECGAYDEAVARLADDPEARARPVREICRAAAGQGALASGAFSASRGELALLNSRGLLAYAPTTQTDLTLVVEMPEAQASAFGHATGWRLAQIDIDHLRERALAQCRQARAPRAVHAGEYPVVLEPYAVLTLLEALADGGLGALAVQEGRSWMNGRLGQPCLSPQFSLVDDALDPHGCPQCFDCEGTPKQRVPLVLNGVPTGPVYDRRTAARESGRASTGHAQPYADEDWDGPAPENLVLAPGGASLAEMIQGVKRGLYVSRFWYVRLTTLHDLGATGTTRDGVWWIEDGELAYPVTHLRFDQSLIEALGGVRAIGREPATLAGFYGVHRVPALALDSFRFVAAEAAEE